jgi:hypothetical protein
MCTVDGGKLTPVNNEIRFRSALDQTGIRSQNSGKHLNSYEELLDSKVEYLIACLICGGNCLLK